MKNKKGQALIEFIMILPVVLLVFTAIADIGGVIYQKYTMQNDIDIIANYVKDGLNDSAVNYANSHKLKLDIKEKGDIFDVTIEKNYKLVTPGLNKKLGNPYKIKETKTSYKNKTTDTNQTNTGGTNE